MDTTQRELLVSVPAVAIGAALPLHAFAGPAASSVMHPARNWADEFGLLNWPKISAGRARHS